MTIHTFKIEREINHSNIVLFPTVVQIDGKVYLIDCGYDETYDDFITELSNLTIRPEDITGILISHDDIDHLGGLANFKICNPSIQVFCSEIEHASVTGLVKSERLVQAENSLKTLPEEYKAWALGFIGALNNIKRFPVDKTFADGEFLIDDLQIIHTPGHTRGHISIYIPSEHTIIANDALVIENGEFDLANPSYTLDLNSAIRSVEKIRNLHSRKIVCYHGGIMNEAIDDQLNKVIQRYKL